MRSIIERLQRLVKSDFNRNFATLLSGSALAQIIPLGASIVLARLYSPEEFGILAIFMSVVMIFTSVVNLRYEFAIPLAIDDKESVVVSLLAGFVAVCFSILLFFIFLFFGEEVLKLIGGEKLGHWLLLVPLTVFMSGVYNCLNYFSVRFKKYKVIAGSNIIRSSSNAGLQLGFGLLGFGQSGLVLGYVFSFFFGNIKMFRNFFLHKGLIQKVTKSDLKKAAIRFKQFPLVSIWGIFLNNLSVNINNFFISRYFGASQLGFYSYSYRYVNAPLSLISSNMGQLFYQVCAEKHKADKDAGQEFLSTLKKLLVVCIPIFTLLFFFIQDAFVIAFGQKWQIAGYYAQILMPLFFIRTIFGPLSLVNTAFEKQVLALGMQASIFIINIGIFCYAYFYKLSMSGFLTLYVYSGVVVYLGLIVISYFVSLKRL